MKKLISKLLQLNSRTKVNGISTAQNRVDETFKNDYVTSVGYETGEEVVGLNTLTLKTDFIPKTLEGTALIQNRNLLNSMPDDTIVNSVNSLQHTSFDRNWVGLPYYNCDPQFQNNVTSKETTDIATTLTGQQYTEAFMYNSVTVAAPRHYGNLLDYLINENVTLDKESELNEVRA